MPYGYHITKDTGLQARLKRLTEHNLKHNPKANALATAPEEMKKTFAYEAAVQISGCMAALEAMGIPLEEALDRFLTDAEKKYPELKQ